MIGHPFWVARDQEGALRIFEKEPGYSEGVWLAPDFPAPTSWFRKMPPRWFPDLKPGQKVKCRLATEGEPVQGRPL